MSVWHPGHCVVSALTNFASHPPHSTNADCLLPFISLSLCISASHIHRTSTSPHPTPQSSPHPPHLNLTTSHPSLGLPIPLYICSLPPNPWTARAFNQLRVIILLSKKNYTRNPYLIAKLVEVETQCIFLPFIPYVPFFHLTSYLSLVSVHPTSYSQPFTSPHPPCNHPSPHLLSYTCIHHSLTPHNPSVFSLSSCVIQYPPHSPHLSSPLPPQVLFVMAPGIQRRTHSLFDQLQYHPLGEHPSSVLMRIYIGECLCYKRDEYIFPQTLYVRSYGTWVKKLIQYTHTYIRVS